MAAPAAVPARRPPAAALTDGAPAAAAARAGAGGGGRRWGGVHPPATRSPAGTATQRYWRVSETLNGTDLTRTFTGHTSGL